MNKNTILVILTTILLAVSATAQDHPAQIDIGFKVGMGVSDVSNYIGESKTRTGFLAGGFLSYSESRLFAIQLELIYIGKGYKAVNAIVRDDTGGVLGTSNFEFILNYLELPLLAKITAPLRGSYLPYFVGGGYGAYNIGSKARFTEGIPFQFDLDNANDVDYGIIAGIGLDMKAGKKGKVLMEIRYEMGFADAIKNTNNHSRMFTFQFAYAW
jgi:hypothetical protein